MAVFTASELILNPDGSIYHLGLQPHQIAKTIILVGDPDRVALVTQHFDTIECTVQKREFKTQTGTYNNKRITVVATGIGTDNIDIVLNELDALANIDFKTRSIKDKITALTFIRIGTSGTIQENIPVDATVINTYAADLTGMLHAYELSTNQTAIEDAFINHTGWSTLKNRPVVVEAAPKLISNFESSNTYKGLTVTTNGFYGAQGRQLRLPLKQPDLNSRMATFKHNNVCITNIEMETSGIYGLSKLLGHYAISLNAILANRKTGRFSKTPKTTIEHLILYTLKRI